MAPDETVLVAGRFMFSTIAFYLHTDVLLTNRRLHAVRPNTLFGLIPVGTARSNFPVDNIAGVNAGTRFDVLGVIVGGLAVMIALATLSFPTGASIGILLLLLGLAAIVGAPKQAIEVMNSGGGTIRFPVSFFERGRTLEFAGQVSEAMARQANQKGASAQIARSPERIDPSTALADLQRLQEQGLITEAEYAAKRAEILGRL